MKLLSAKLFFVLVLILMSAALVSAAPNIDVFCGKQTVGGSNYYVLANAQTSVSINASDLTLACLKVPGKENMVTEPGWPLFRIGFVQEPNNWFETKQSWSISGLEATDRYTKITHNGKTTTLELHYDKCTVSPAWKSVDVVVSISLDPTAKYTRWNMSISGIGPLKLGEIRFPVLTGLGSTRKGTEKTDYIVGPVFSGMKFTEPRTKNPLTQGFIEYPGPGMAVQLLTYCDGINSQSLMMSTLDNRGYRKTYESLPMPGGKSFAWSVIHYPDGRESNGKWSMPYGVAIGAINGDWYDAAKLYRGWASKQSRWSPILTRKGVPDWFKNLSVWYQGQDRNPSEELMVNHVARLKAIRERLGEDIAFHWYMWQKDKDHDYRYPDYFPSQPGFKEAVAELQKSGVHCMPYMNMRLFDSLTTMWTTENAEPWAIPDAKGKLYDGIINDRVKMYTMCAGTKYWRDKLVYIITKMFKDYGTDGVYLDELHTYAYLCYATNHEHKGCGGTYLADGYREVINRVRQSFPDRQLMLTGENISETYADIVDAQLVAHSDQNPDSIPLLQAIMKDCTVELGLTMRRDEDWHMECYAARTGFALTRGRQLGWIQFDQGDMMDADHVKQVDFLKSCAHARRAGQNYLLYGEFLRTPVVSAGPLESVRWFADKPNVMLNPVLAEAYKSPDGKLGIVAANITAEVKHASFKLNYKDWSIVKGKAYKMLVWQGDKWSEPKTITTGDSITLDIPAYQPVILELQKQ